MRPRQGWEGWDDYAPFYDWENARTLGRRDVAFWTRTAASASGRALELGCGTGRVAVPLAKAGIDLVGIDRSHQMLERARHQLAKSPIRQCARLVRGDIRDLPFGGQRFSIVIAAYGILQSLLSDRDLSATLDSVARVLIPGGMFGIDLVPDVPEWREYDNRVQLRGPAGGGSHLTLVESVRQDRRRRLTTFTERYIERRGRQKRVREFDLTFRTLSVKQMTRRLERAGFAVEAVLGDYRGRPWDERSDVWILIARLR